MSKKVAYYRLYCTYHEQRKRRLCAEKLKKEKRTYGATRCTRAFYKAHCSSAAVHGSQTPPRVPHSAQISCQHPEIKLGMKTSSKVVFVIVIPLLWRADVLLLLLFFLLWPCPGLPAQWSRSRYPGQRSPKQQKFENNVLFLFLI